MANVQHKDLTGTNLHEPKGADAAAADTVYIADGAGSGSWAKVGGEQIDEEEVNPFSGELLHIQETLDSGETPPDANTGFNSRELNNVRWNGISGASLDGHEIVLPAGVYHVQASAPAAGVNGHRLALYNITDDEVPILGTSELADVEDALVQNRSFLNGRFEIDDEKHFVLSHWCENSFDEVGLGVPISNGDDEVYAEIMIWKVY